MPMLVVNSTELYHELQGEGPPVLLIMGVTGDGGHFEQIAKLLSDEFTVVTYDRRGNGRSPRPPGWQSTSIEEQSDDAAALLQALGLAPAAVFGASIGGVIAMGLVTRHPDAVRGAILHEPAFWSLFDDLEHARGVIGAIVRQGMAAGGPPAVIERFMRYVGGDANWERLQPDLRKRILASAETWLEIERGRFDFVPDDRTLSAIATPVQVLVGDGTLPFFSQAARRLAERLGVNVAQTAGTHLAYLDHPQDLVRSIRPFLREVSSASA